MISCGNWIDDPIGARYPPICRTINHDRKAAKPEGPDRGELNPNPFGEPLGMVDLLNQNAECLSPI